MTLIWRNSPWLRILIPFFCGILCFENGSLWLSIFTTCCLCGAFWIKKKQILYSSFFFFSAWILLGSSLTLLQDRSVDNGQYNGVIKPIKHFGKGNQWIMEFSTRRKNEVISIPCICTLKQDTIYQSYLCSAKIQTLKSAAIPKDPIYHFLHQKRILHHAELIQFQPISQLPFNEEQDPQWIRKSREYLDSTEYALVLALLIGKTNEIDKAVKQEYKTLGISHLLAVSGMHVGLIYLLLQPLVALIFLKRLPNIQAVTIIATLWFYCSICQFSPSIVRACYMFSILQIGKISKRKTSPYNLLAFSALSIVLFSPDDIYDWGFVLSHLAVLGLVIFQKVSHSFMHDFKKWKQFLMQMTLTSIQAQWITSPFTMLFNPIFSTYFLIANILLIPYSTLLLYVSILGMVLIHILPWPAFFDCWKMLINGMNGLVHVLNELPFPNISLQHFCWIESIVIYGMGWVIYRLILKSWWLFYIGLLVILNCLLIHQNFHYWRHPTELHIFQYRGQKSIILSNGYFQKHYPTTLPSNIVPADCGKLLAP